MTPEQERTKLRDYVIWSKNNKIARLVSNSLDREEQLMAQVERENKEKHAFRRLENQHRKEKEQLAQKVAEQDKEIQRLRDALEQMDDRKNAMMPRSQMARIAKETIDQS